MALQWSTVVNAWALPPEDLKLLDEPWPSVTYSAPSWPACAACGKTATTITVGKGVPVSDAEQTFTIASYECPACGLELHALPH